MIKPQIGNSSKDRLYINIQHQMIESSFYTKRILYVMLAGVAWLPAAYADNVLTLVPSGVSSVAQGLPTPTNPMTLWASIPDCYKQSEAEPHPSGDGNQPVQFLRGSREGDKPRAIMSVNPSRPMDQCNPYRLLSNIVSDGTDIFYIANPGNNHAGLWRRPINSNPEDPSTLIKDLGSTILITGAEVHLNETYNTVVFVIVHYQANLFTTEHDEIQEYTKTGTFLATVDQGTKDSIRDMKSDSRYLYWRKDNLLRRDDMTNGTIANVITTAFDAYETIGLITPRNCGQFICSPRSEIYYSRGRELYWLNADSGAATSIYSSNDDSVFSPKIVAITHDYLYPYFIESRYAGSLGGLREQQIYKSSDLIAFPISGDGLPLGQLQADNTYLYFSGSINKSLFRLRKDTAPIPVYDLLGNGLEITQGLQNRDNRVRLIENKRTFAIFHVKSNDTREVPNVTANLRVYMQNGHFLGELAPINRVGKKIKVLPNPKRENLDQSFQFELPLEWTRIGPLQLYATVNPNTGGILEDRTNNNVSILSPSFSPSPRLEVTYVNFMYPAVINKELKWVSVNSSDLIASQDWITQLYPLSLARPWDNGPGIHFFTHDVVDLALTSRSDQSDADCKSGALNECASNYVHGRLRAMRKSGEISAVGKSYGNIPEIPGFGIRGSTPGDNIVSTGPSGNRPDYFYINYAAHEIGHTLGRSHPKSGLPCSGTSYNPVDDNPPFLNAALADANIPNFLETEAVGLMSAKNWPSWQLTFLDPTKVHDLMSYCDPYWISEYNYEGIYNHLIAGNNRAVALTAQNGAAANNPGDWLILTGMINPSTETGSFGILKHTDSVADDMPPTPGNYTLRFLDDQDSILSSHSFSAFENSEGTNGLLSFDLVVPYDNAARKLSMVNSTSGKVMATKTISSNIPSIKNIELLNPTEPVDGTVSIDWSASDADGDALAFDLLASHDGGASFKPIVLSIPQSQYELDTSILGGGSTIFRVVASDGLHTAYADSTPFNIKPKPPTVVITSPTDGLSVQWNQLVTLEMSARDIQDGEVADENIVWYNHYGVLGTGHILQTDQLPVGNYGIAVAATNSLGLQAVASIQVSVNDDLNPPGPILSSVPTSLFFTAAPDESATQSAQLATSNAGSGTLTFSATSDAEWLKLADTDGSTGQIASITAPANLGITVNSSLVPAYTETTGHITLQNLADPEDKLTIPITIAKGRPENRPPPVDSDGDGIPDDVDNCIQVPNSTQLDTDSDGYGNYCDADLNNDNHVNSLDLGLFKRTYLSSTPNLDADFNGDGKVNSLDLGLFKKMYLKPVGPSAKILN